MLSTGWPKLRFFCPRLFPAETPQKSPKVAISATTSRTLRRAAKPTGQGVAAPARAAHRARSGARRHTPGQELATRTHQVRPSLAGQGVALGLVLLCVLQRLRANRPLGLAGQALAAISLIAKHQPGQELATSTGSTATPGTGWPRAGHQPGRRASDSIERTGLAKAGHQHTRQEEKAPAKQEEKRGALNKK